MVIIAACALALAGCDHAGRGPTVAGTASTFVTANATPNRAQLRAVPLPDRALLQHQPEPDCAFKDTAAKPDDPRKLDYERQCYRHAEIITRGRLQQLQTSVDKTIKAVKRSGS